MTTPEPDPSAAPMLPLPTHWSLPEAGSLPDELAGEDLVAIGADLEPATLLAAYTRGLFPMAVSDQLGWWSPDPRGVLPLDGLVVSRSLRSSCRSFGVTLDAAFAEVVAGCAHGGREGHWISEEFVTAYRRLHELGWAHSIEVWSGQALVGGLYGVAIGGLFAGESMFHRQRDASKVALVALVQLLAADGESRLLDVQWRTDHLARMGAVELPRIEYAARLAAALRTRRPRALERPGSRLVIDA